MNLLIERAVVEDAENIRTAQKLAFEDCFIKYKFCPAYNVKTEEVGKYIAENYVYKIIIDEKIVGSVFVCKLGEREYELNTITVHPDYQNLGIGSKAIEFVENELSDAESWVLETPEGEIRNRYLYEKFGYRVVDKRYINEYLTLLKYKK